VLTSPILSHSTSLGKTLHERVPVRNQAGRVVGCVRFLNGRRTFVKSVNPDLHMLRQPRAWANDRTVLDQLARIGAEFVCHQERASRRRWWASLAAFGEHGFPVVRGCGEQVGLGLKFWHVEDPDRPQQVPLFPEVSR